VNQLNEEIDPALSHFIPQPSTKLITPETPVSTCRVSEPVEWTGEAMNMNNIQHCDTLVDPTIE
jgi:hypothetical protein